MNIKKRKKNSPVNKHNVWQLLTNNHNITNDVIYEHCEAESTTDKTLCRVYKSNFFKAHPELINKTGSVKKEDNIKQALYEAWKEMPSSMLAYILGEDTNPMSPTPKEGIFDNISEEKMKTVLL